MGIRDYLPTWLGGGKSAAAKEEKQTQRIINFLSQDPNFAQNNYRSFAKNGFEDNEIVFASIRKRMDTVAQADLKVFDENNSVVPEHPAAVVLDHPNPVMSNNFLLKLWVLHYDLAGNVFWHLMRGPRGDVREIWPLRPDRVKIKPRIDGTVEFYIHDLGTKKIWIEPEDIIHWRFPDPLNAFFGMPPLRAAFKSSQVDSESTRFVKAILENFAVPGVAIFTEEDVGKDKGERLAKMWTQRFGGKNRGEPVFMQGTNNIETVGLNLNDLAFPELTNRAETRVSMVFSVHPVLIGSKSGLENSTFNNFSEARLGFVEESMIPTWSTIESWLKRSYLPEFSDQPGESIRFDMQDVPALRDVRNEISEKAQNEYEAGLITLNEGREKIQRGEVEGGDVFKVDGSQVLVPEGRTDELLEQRSTDPVEESSAKMVKLQEEQMTLQSPEKKDRFSQIEIFLGTIGTADNFFADFLMHAKEMFSRQADDVMSIFNQVKQNEFGEIQQQRLEQELERTRQVWASREAKKLEPVYIRIFGEASRTAADVQFGIDFELGEGLIQSFTKEYSFKFAEKIANTSADRVSKTITEAVDEQLTVNQTAKRLREEFDAWDNQRSIRVARSETIRSSNRGAQLAYREAGIRKKVWIAATDACPFCADLDGTVVEIEKNFADIGDQLQPEGVDRPFEVTYEAVTTPPLHPNCRCSIGPKT